MAARPELSFKSYDRLFPSQDTLPEGGFGNLIALPLQLAAAAAGNSLFLDEDLESIPMEDQVELLANVKRIAPATVRSFVDTATSANSVLGVDGIDTEEDLESPAPWTQPDLSFQAKTTKIAPCAGGSSRRTQHATSGQRPAGQLNVSLVGLLLQFACGDIRWAE